MYLFFLVSLIKILLVQSINLRPQYHFTCDSWLNDPNGPMYWNGYYHLFYQQTPGTTLDGIKVWGHAVSTDLVYWENLPIALAPSEEYDIGGIWSGSATVTENGPVIFYTGIYSNGTEAQCMAVPSNLSDPLLVNWTKNDNNPLIKCPYDNTMPTPGFRDPTTAWIGDDGLWYIAAGSGYMNGGAAIFLFSSPDLEHWTFEHPLFQIQEEFSDSCECPDLYPISGGDHHVMKYSWQGKDWWRYGDYSEKNKSFTMITEGIYDFGFSCFYASKSFNDEINNRQILWGWQNELDDPSNAAKRGFAGSQSMPRVITIENQRVYLNPIPEMEFLRMNHQSLYNVKVSEGIYGLSRISGDSLEIHARIQTTDAQQYGINVRVSPDREEFTSIFMSAPTEVMTNMDTPGPVSFYFQMNTDNYTVCQLACEADVLCVSWTYIRPNISNNNPPGCCFRTPALDIKPNSSCCVSQLLGFYGVNRTSSSLNSSSEVLYIQEAKAQVIPTLTQQVDIRIFVDHSVIEVFVNGGESTISTKIYPTLDTSVGMELFSYGGTTIFDSIEVWEMGSIFKSKDV